jgi:isopropylmalate/homocitrate/citramalate synthase
VKTTLKHNFFQGMAMVNILQALEHGIRVIDASCAGLGGCPYAKGASGNVATEDVVYLLDSMGVSTGVDLDRILETSRFILAALNRTSLSKVAMAMSAKRE